MRGKRAVGPLLALMSVGLLATAFLSGGGERHAGESPSAGMETIPVLDAPMLEGLLDQYAPDGWSRGQITLALGVVAPHWPDERWDSDPPSIFAGLGSTVVLVAQSLQGERAEISFRRGENDDSAARERVAKSVAAAVGRLFEETNPTREALLLRGAPSSPYKPNTGSTVVKGLEDLAADQALWFETWNGVRTAWQESGTQPVEISVRIDIITDLEASEACTMSPLADEIARRSQESGQNYYQLLVECTKPFERTFVWSRLCDMRTDAACRRFITALGEVFVTGIEGLGESPEAVAELLALSGPVEQTTHPDSPAQAPG